MTRENDTEPPLDEGLEYGHIRTFARRRGHLSKGQERAIAEGMPVWGLDYHPDQTLNFSQIFGREAPTWLEIGFGMGETTAQIALAHPEVNYLGVEVYPAGVGAMLKRIEEHEIKNVRIMSHDVIDILQHMIPVESLDRVLVYFPDPWRKKRHHKRRLIRPDFLDILCPKMRVGSVLHCATDWEDYAYQMLEVLEAEPSLSNQSEGFSPRPDTRPLTKFENRGLRLGHGVWDLLFEKI
ncbi:MAG: tRNA (guanosine(46)-N7)-methyltransferase TrmB [Limnobacter sp.]|nr:tRNA (guanosine(46)-N7)-methyltransferase TrmB [Limnobacter sp.]